MLVWGQKKGPRTKGKRCTTEEKIRILREADAGKSIKDFWLTHDPLAVLHGVLSRYDFKSIAS